LKAEIRRSQYLSFRSTNSIMIELYWSIGKQIAEKQKELGWGKSVIENLAKDLQTEFKGTTSFSPDNLQRMRQLYVEYNDITISGHAVPEITLKNNNKVLVCSGVLHGY